MSERKSWDIQPKRRVAPAPPPIERPRPAARQNVQPARRFAPRPERRVPTRPQKNTIKLQPKPRPMPEPQAQAIRRRTPVPQGKDREPLKARRKRARTRALWTFSILTLVCIGAIFGSFWLGALRIQEVGVMGPDSDGMQAIATTALAGSYHYIIPRNSIFFFPEQEIRADILKQYPEISAVSISRTSLSTISISSVPREAAFIWCGDTYLNSMPTVLAALPQDSRMAINGTSTSDTVASSTPSAPTCYSADAQGVIFAPVTDSSVIENTLRVYGPLAGNGDSNPSPLGSVIAQANLIPNALQFIKVIKNLGVPIVAFVIRGDEADLYAQSGTRITYVLGHEEVTAQVAEAAFPSLNLDDGSLEYVDLRFEGKAYYKKVGSTESDTATSTTEE